MGKVPKGRTWSSFGLDMAWEWWSEDEVAAGYGLQISLTPTKRRGVWKIVVRALWVVDGKPAGVAYQVGREWPDATFTSFDAAVFAAVNDLAREMALPSAMRSPP